MSNINTTITIKKTIKKELKSCMVHKRETWDDLMIRLIKMYKEVKKNNEEKSK